MTSDSASHTGRCEPHGQIEKRRTKDEQKTNKERTKNEQKTVRAARADKEKTNKERTNDGASRTDR